MLLSKTLLPSWQLNIAVSPIMSMRATSAASSAATSTEITLQLSSPNGCMPSKGAFAAVSSPSGCTSSEGALSVAVSQLIVECDIKLPFSSVCEGDVYAQPEDIIAIMTSQNEGEPSIRTRWLIARCHHNFALNSTRRKLHQKPPDKYAIMSASEGGKFDTPSTSESA